MGIYSNYIFPKFFDVVVGHKIFDGKRAKALTQVSGKILEIGIGTGRCLDFYPSHVTEITAVDPNSGMKRELESKLKTQRIRVDFVLGSAEALPFRDASFQTVVSMLTMCSIPNLQQALCEIRRVLTPNGKLIFLDHGLSPDPTVARLQNFLNPVQNIVGCGCKLTVNVEAELKTAGFKIGQLENYYIERAPKFIGHIYDGVASP